MLKIEGVSKSYGSGKIKAVDDISFDVKPGEIFGFLGPNGAGKTTTIKMIVGLLKPDSGTIHINGINNQVDSINSKRQFSYVPDSHEVFEKLKGIEYLNFMGDVYGVDKEKRKSEIQRYLKLFDMEKAVNDPISSYSHGMKQKIVLIGALLHDPRVFILDEPMVGLDPKSSYNLKELMKQRCAEGKSVFFSTHVLEVAEKICDRIAIINNGKIIAQGTMEQLKGDAKDKESLEKIFLELTEI
ncbi:ABC transporter ATP-binding protein [Alkalibacter saccharofermentans]|uniref:ABC-2 type transport system ATP-binding protein n=1 Tax=Alkalibacter saccharofermentans DSM 14828 TaxID=1120975 RepID=A0A1M4WVQ0_9FIRM|nr:ABC transporter ATP-binding protein [Alkalibacter saccharofermentans]SHE85143.1 ABC-2 type transport system ATP-binding protein [Alkalibacter saccharofermentans DSM 14828]